MSDPTQTPPDLDEGDREILEAVDRLATGSATAPGDRPVVETLASLAWTVEERSPDPAVRRRILERAAGAARPSRPEGAPGPQRWTLPLAASIAAALLAVSAWQQVVLSRQGRQLAELASASAPPSELARELDRQRRLLSMATAEGSEFCLLRPVGGEPLYPEARGTLVVSPDRQSWYLRVRGLGPLPGEGSYRVWFHTENGPQAGPSFEVGPADGFVELESASPPRGMRAVSVTQAADPEATAPAGPQVLYADQAMTLL